MLDVKIKVNEVASVDESHYSQDHFYVLKEEDYLPFRLRERKMMRKGVEGREDIKSERDYDIIKKKRMD
jgi:hypothetical protein